MGETIENQIHFSPAVIRTGGGAAQTFLLSICEETADRLDRGFSLP